jgi:hypothetical protein
VDLARWQRNGLYKAVVAGGLDAAECDFDYDDAGARITHLRSGSYFRLEGHAGNYESTSVVVDGFAWPQPAKAYSWNRVGERVRQWARDVKEVVDTPDLWAELQQDREILAGSRYEHAENTPFTPTERAEIAEQLRRIHDYAENTHSLSEAQMLSLRATLGQIKTAADRIGRKDWSLLYGAMFTWMFDTMVRPEVAREIFLMALHAIDALILGGGGATTQLLDPL